MSASPLRGPGEIAEDEAEPSLASIYARLRAALGVDFVPTIYRMLGVHEAYLRAATDALEDLLASQAARGFAKQARSAARSGLDGLRPAPLSLGAHRPAVEAIFSRYNRANPRNLIFARALLPAAPTSSVNVMGPGLGKAPDMSDPDQILADVLAAHGGFIQPGLWRELAEFPNVLSQAWAAVRPLADAAAFQDTRKTVVAMAADVTAGVVAPGPRELGLDEDEAASIEGILAWFTSGIAAMIVEIEYLRLIADRDR